MTETKTSIPEVTVTPAPAVEKVSIDAVGAKIDALKAPLWEPRTLGEARLKKQLALAIDTMTNQDAMIAALKKANTEHVEQLAKLTGECEVLRRVVAGYEKDIANFKGATFQTMREAEADNATLTMVLEFVKKHPVGKDIDFAPLFSA
jgi:hypothetical protein